ncbi:MAG: KamA family radical SAM protein, partial [Planctomycetota bacterium]|nr:KamA family radical SAM protein [Planctomycetota bacterium]
MPIVSGSQGVVPASSGIHDNDWQGSLRRAIRDPAELCARLELPESYVAAARRAAAAFPLLVPEEFLNRMRRRDPHDPLLRQVLPLELENDEVPGYGQDPLEERHTQDVSGMLTKYPGRSLLITTGACAVHCRYCFRRHFPYSASPKSTTQWEPVLRQLRSDRSLEEVILSGGDPLTLPDERLAWLLQQLSQIEHVRRIRVHTRLPIMIPSRVNGPLLEMLSQPGQVRIVVVHVNHAAELDASVSQSLAALQMAGILLLNQAVLLRG